jgi:hypothetical protein
MAMNERGRRRGAREAEKLLGGQTPVREYVVGHGHFRMTSTAAWTIGIAACVFVGLLVVTGTLWLPGGLVIWAVVRSLRPYLGIALTDRGLAILHLSMLNNRPARIVALLPYGPVWATSPKGSVTAQMGPEQVTFTRKEYDRLAAALAIPVGAPQPVQ